MMDRPGGDFERGFRSCILDGKIDEHAQPIAFLDERRPMRSIRQARRVGVHIAQRHGGVAIVKQPKMP